MLNVAYTDCWNGNGKTDTNFIGIPKEDWGVSNNVRPDFRAPQFEEACVELTEDADHQNLCGSMKNWP